MQPTKKLNNADRRPLRRTITHTLREAYRVVFRGTLTQLQKNNQNQGWDRQVAIQTITKHKV